jgi:hypothetical protein
LQVSLGPSSHLGQEQVIPQPTESTGLEACAALTIGDEAFDRAAPSGRVVERLLKPGEARADRRASRGRPVGGAVEPCSLGSAEEVLKRPEPLLEGVESGRRRHRERDGE